MKSVWAETTRLEALSDGTFAIIITLLVLEIHRPVQRWVISEGNFFKPGLRISPMQWHSSTPAEARPRPIRESDRKDQDKIMTSHTVIVPLVVAAVSRRCGGYLAATSLTFLKPRFKRFLMPVSARLARAGVVANQVTTVSIVGSLIMGGMLSLFHSHSILFGLLPVWVLVRMGCATIDGTLAIDFGQKSRLGGVLNEVGDVVSDVVLFLPLASVVPFSASSVGTVVVLAISSEVAGMLGPALGGSRREDGPVGKADRGIALGILGLWTCCGGPLPSEAAWATLPFGCLLAITTANRLYLARTEGLGAGR